VTVEVFSKSFYHKQSISPIKTTSSKDFTGVDFRLTMLDKGITITYIKVDKPFTFHLTHQPNHASSVTTRQTDAVREPANQSQRDEIGFPDIAIAQAGASRA
jgi:hypothetical protein